MESQPQILNSGIILKTFTHGKVIKLFIYSKKYHDIYAFQFYPPLINLYSILHN